MLYSKKLHKTDFVYNFIFLISSFVLFFYIKDYSIVYVTSLSCFILFYLKYFSYLLKDNIKSIDLFIVLFVSYMFIGFVYFNSESLLSITKIFFPKGSDSFFNLLTNDNLIRINSTYILSIFPLMLLINKTRTSIPFHIKNVYNDSSKMLKFTNFCGFFTFIVLLFSFLFVFYIIVISKGGYLYFDETSGLGNKLGWLIVIITGLISISFVKKDYKEVKWFTLVVILFMICVMKTHFRMFSMVIGLSLLINLEMRGFQIKRKHFIFFILIFFIIAFQAVLRFKSFNLSDTNAVIFTVFAEFILSQFYYVSVLLNPNGYEVNMINYLDFFTQFLPTSIRPVSAVTDFFHLNVKQLHLYGIGGTPFLAQAILYLRFFFPVLFIFLSIYLIFLRRIIESRTISIWLVGIPISLMFLPRTEFWLQRGVFINVAFVLVLKIIYSTYHKYFKKV